MRFTLFFIALVSTLWATNRELEVHELFEQKFLADSFVVDKVGLGLTNRNYHVTNHEQHYFVRMGTDNAAKLYISREIEQQCYEIAEKLNLAPPLLYCDSKRGILVTPFIFQAANYGKIQGSWSGNPKEVIARSIKAMKRIHSVHAFPTREAPYPFRIMNYYHKVGLKLGVSFPDDLEKALAVAKNLNISFGQRVLCHHDFYWGNLLFDGTKLWVIDWEYADWDDPLFDLAGFCIEQDFDDEERDFALQEYLSSYSLEDKSKFEKMCMLYALKTAMWSWIQMKLEPDMRADIEPIAIKHMATFWRFATASSTNQ